jgi:hypothetical protein
MKPSGRFPKAIALSSKRNNGFASTLGQFWSAGRRDAKLKRLLADAVLDNVALEDPRFAQSLNPDKVSV